MGGRDLNGPAGKETVDVFELRLDSSVMKPSTVKPRQETAEGRPNARPAACKWVWPDESGMQPPASGRLSATAVGSRIYLLLPSPAGAAGEDQRASLVVMDPSASRPASRRTLFSYRTREAIMESPFCKKPATADRTVGPLAFGARLP